MAKTLVLTRKRISKNGMVSYKTGPRRTDGTVYFDRRMFAGDPPETFEVTGENLADPAPEPVRKAKAEGDATAGEGEVSEQASI